MKWVYCIVLCIINLTVIVAFLTYVHASPAHLYIPKLLNTHCLPTTICVTLMFVVFDLTFVILYYYCILLSFTVVGRCIVYIYVCLFIIVDDTLTSSML